MLTGTQLHKKYDGKTVLDGIDVQISPGSITALLGSNGCGKSTLLRALALIEPEVDGTVSIDGTAYSFANAAMADPPPWPAVTLVFQQLFLWPHLTVRRNITLPQAAQGDADAKARFDEVVQIFELERLVDRYPNQISLGQRQRVALARAVAVRPRYLLLDEVTSALDIEHVTKLLNYLRTLRQTGIGILLVTHLIGFARDTADSVLFMANGRIAEQGDIGVLSAPRTGELARFLDILESSDRRTPAATTERAS